MQERLTYNVEEAGALLNISRTTAYKLVQSGELYAIRLGRRLLVPKIAVERMLNGMKDGPNNGKQPES